MKIPMYRDYYYIYKNIIKTQGSNEMDKLNRDPNLSSPATRKYVRAIAKMLGIKLERKLMKKDYCQDFINKHKIQYLQYLNDNNIVPPPTEKQKRYIKKMQKVLKFHYKDSEIYLGYSNIEEAKKYIEKWKPIYHSLVSVYYAAHPK
jgi:hypothetical protein